MSLNIKAGLSKKDAWRLYTVPSRYAGLARRPSRPSSETAYQYKQELKRTDTLAPPARAKKGASSSPKRGKKRKRLEEEETNPVLIPGIFQKVKKGKLVVSQQSNPTPTTPKNGRKRSNTVGTTSSVGDEGSANDVAKQRRKSVGAKESVNVLSNENDPKKAGLDGSLNDLNRSQDRIDLFDS